MDTQESEAPVSPVATVSQAPATASAPVLDFPDGPFTTNVRPATGGPPVTLQVSPRMLSNPTIVHLQTTQGALAAIRLFGTLATSELQR